MWVASGQTYQKSSMLTSDAFGNFFRNVTMSSGLLPVSGSQVSGQST